MQQFLVRVISYSLTLLFCLFAIYSQVFQVVKLLNNSAFMCELQFRARTQENLNFCIKMFNANHYGDWRQYCHDLHKNSFLSNNNYLCLFYWTCVQRGSSLKCLLLSAQSSVCLSVFLTFCMWLEIYNLQKTQAHTCT